MGDPQGYCRNQDLRVFPDMRSTWDSWPFFTSAGSLGGVPESCSVASGAPHKALTSYALEREVSRPVKDRQCRLGTGQARAAGVGLADGD